MQTTSATSSPTVWCSTFCQSTWHTARTMASWGWASTHRWVATQVSLVCEVLMTVSPHVPPSSCGACGNGLTKQGMRWCSHPRIHTLHLWCADPGRAAYQVVASAVDGCQLSAPQRLLLCALLERASHALCCRFLAVGPPASCVSANCLLPSVLWLPLCCVATAHGEPCTAALPQGKPASPLGAS